MTESSPKPQVEEWLHWAQIVIDRLSICVNVYSHPPHEDIFMPEKDRQQRNAQIVDLLRRIHALTDESEMPSDSLTELDHHGERVVDGLALLFKETLQQLPELSLDMQKLLKSPWHSKFSSRLAENLFRGPMGDEQQGIGSGIPEHGRLPEVLANLLEREQIGDGRAPRETHSGEPRREDDVARRWGERNSRMLRSAGRIE